MSDLTNELLAVALPAIQQIVIIVVGFVATWVLTKVKTIIAHKIGEEREERILALIWEVVNAVEQVAPTLGIKKEEKFDQAVDWATEMLARRGIVLTPDELKIFIEAVVRQINLENKN